MPGRGRIGSCDQRQDCRVQCLTKCICQDPHSWPSAHIPSILGDALRSRQYISETAPLPRDLQTGRTRSVRDPPTPTLTPLTALVAALRPNMPHSKQPVGSPRSLCALRGRVPAMPDVTAHGDWLCPCQSYTRWGHPARGFITLPAPQQRRPNRPRRHLPPMQAEPLGCSWLAGVSRGWAREHGRGQW